MYITMPSQFVVWVFRIKLKSSPLHYKCFMNWAISLTPGLGYLPGPWTVLSLWPVNWAISLTRGLEYLPDPWAGLSLWPVDWAISLTHGLEYLSDP